MKKILCVILALCMTAALAGCGEKTPSGGTDGTKATEKAKSGGIDVDLTKLSSTMVYSEVYNMMMNPSDYIGKTVKMRGQFAVYQTTEQDYFACVIADATACCQQGLEFVLSGTHSYPDDYPALGTEITVVGQFQTYMEGGQMYCHLCDAVLA